MLDVIVCVCGWVWVCVLRRHRVLLMKSLIKDTYHLCVWQFGFNMLQVEDSCFVLYRNTQANERERGEVCTVVGRSSHTANLTANHATRRLTM